MQVWAVRKEEVQEKEKVSCKLSRDGRERTGERMRTVGKGVE
jgi:hypothetical protein